MINPNNRDKYDMLIFFASTKAEIIQYLNEFLVGKRGMKYSLNLQVKFYKEKDGQRIYQSPHFRSKNKIVLNVENTQIDLSEAHQKTFKSFDAFIRESSGWVLDEILKIDINLMNYVPLAGHSYIPTHPH